MAPGVVAIIPARGGSQGVPRKNLRTLAGLPLLAHTVRQALAARLVSRVVVSTDDAEIGAVAREYGADVIPRPPELATSDASSESVLLHALDYLGRGDSHEPGVIVFLQCTSPIRREDDIDRAIELFLERKADSLLSVVPSHRFLWHRPNGVAQSINYDVRARPRRQDMEPQYVENGSIYVLRPWVLRELRNRLGGKIELFVMDSWSQVDIDSVEDFALCEWILAQRRTSAPVRE